MAARGLLALVDDIAALTKIAARKTAGLSGDDLAVNAHALAGQGIDPRRELPMVWKVAKGSLKNKFKYLIPAAMGLSILAPWAIPPLMMAGGAFLVYEGMEKMLHKNKDGDSGQPKDPKALEEERVAGAIKTDFVLSAEIIVVSLGAVAAAPLLTQLGVLAAIGIGMTAGIYGLVGGLVKLDDIGLHLEQKTGDGWWAKTQRNIGKALVQGVPPMMKGLSFLGTAAMFAVGGGILLHGIPMLGHAVMHAGALLSSSPFIASAVETAASIGLGMVTGLLAIPAVKVLKEPVSHVLGLAKDACDKHIGQPVKAKMKAAWGRIWGRSPEEISNDNAEPARVPEPAPALAKTADLSAALNAAAPKQVEPAVVVQPPAREFSSFEKRLKQNFGK
jgi:predicted DNA repair protein MutK